MSSKWWDWAKVAIVLGAIEGALWSQGRAQGVWALTAAALIVAFAAVTFPSVRRLGIGLRGVIGSLWAIPAAALFCGLVVLVAWKAGSLKILYGAQPVWWHALGYALWAFEQQFILNSFFYNHFEKLLGDNRRAVLVTAALFSLVHLPNPVLVPATFIGGLFFVAIFRQKRNIYPLGIAHAMFGLTLAISIPDQWIRHMRVGLSFLRFHVHG